MVKGQHMAVLFENCHYKAMACKARHPDVQIPQLCRDCCPQLPCPCSSILSRLVLIGESSPPKIPIAILWSRFSSSVKLCESVAELFGFSTTGDVAMILCKCPGKDTSESSGHSGIVARDGALYSILPRLALALLSLMNACAINSRHLISSP